MPCRSIRTTSVDLSAIGKIDVDLLAGAFRALGLENVRRAGACVFAAGATYEAGTVRFSGSARSITLDQVKQAYSAEVVKTTAKKYGWLLKEVKPFEYLVTKRGF